MKKIISCFIMIVIASIIFIPSVKAAGFDFTATSNVNSAEVGNNIIITIGVSNIDAGEIGINTVYTVLEFDEDIFEYVSAKGKNNWSLNYNNIKDNEQYGTLLATITEAGITEEQEIGEITLKVKDNSEGKEGKINFTEISTNNGKVNIYDEDKTININISSKGNNSSNLTTIILIASVSGIAIIATIAVVIYKKRKS